MKKAVIILSLLAFTAGTMAQDYTLTPVDLNPRGHPKDLLLGIMKVANNGSNAIDLKIKRIVKDLPTNWTSCFCYPICIAPWIDTIDFTLNANDTTWIAPNFGTYVHPDSGTVVALIWQVGYQSAADTMVFTGTTAYLDYSTQPLWWSTYSTQSQTGSIITTGQADHVTLSGDIAYPATISVFDMQGRLITRQLSYGDPQNTTALAGGFYLLHIRDAQGKEHSNKLYVQQ